MRYIAGIVLLLLLQCCPVWCVDESPTLTTPTVCPTPTITSVSVGSAHNIQQHSTQHSENTPTNTHEPILPPQNNIPITSTTVTKKRICKPAAPPTEECRHLTCEYGQYGDERAIFTNKKGRKAHEHCKSYHPCAAGDDCFACKQIKAGKGFSTEEINPVPCKHTYCRARLSSDKSALKHMKSIKHKPEKCGDNCAGCTQLQRNEDKKTTRDKQKHTCNPCSPAPPPPRSLPATLYSSVVNLASQIQESIPFVSSSLRRSIIQDKANMDELYVCHLPPSGPCSIMPLSDLKDSLCPTLDLKPKSTSNAEPITNPSVQMINGMSRYFTKTNFTIEVKDKDYCTLRDIRWHSLLRGSREQPKSNIEQNHRLEEARALLTHVFNLPYEKCLQQLLADPAVSEQLLSILPEAVIAGIRFPDHTVDALLEFKDTLLITDGNWPYVVEKMHLGPHATLHYLRQKKNEMNKQLEPQKTAGGRGHELNIRKMIQYLLEKSPPKDASNPVLIKFALDGGTITSTKRTQLEQATLQILTDHSLQEIKSHTNAHQWMVYLGPEDYTTLKEELVHATPEIKNLLQNNKIQVGETEYTLDLFITCDMKCLANMLGLYEVHHPKSKYKCCWCEVDSDHIHDFTIKKWPFRDIQKMTEIGNALGDASASVRKDHAAKKFGIKYPPLLPFPLEKTVPCMLHATSGLAKLLLRHLCKEGDTNPSLASALRDEFPAIGVKLVPIETNKGKIRTLSEQLKASRIQRPQYLAIIENHSNLIAAYKRHSVRDPDYKKGVEVLWQQFYYLLSKASQEKVTITEQEWLDKALIFGTNFTLLYCNEDVTPYLHVFVYHIGYFLEKYGSIEIFGNYAIECRVSYNKRIRNTATNGFSNLTANENLTFQILTKSWRDDVHRIEGTATTKSRKRKNESQDAWAKKSLKNGCLETVSFNRVHLHNQLEEDMSADEQHPAAPSPSVFTTSTAEQYQSDLKAKTVPQLKDMLRALHLGVSGVKATLVSRLVEHKYGATKETQPHCTPCNTNK